MAGRRQRSKGTGTLIRRDRGPWIARWFDHEGRRKERSTGTTDKAAAERILGKRVADTALRRDGVVDARADRYGEAERKPIAAHIDEWIADLAAKEVTPKQTALLRKRVETLLATIKVQRVSEFAASAVQTALGDLHSEGSSLQTCQHYLRAIKQFARWLKRDGRVREDALAHLTGFNAATDRQYERRALDADELRLLIEATENAPAWRGMTGAERAMLYRVATGTGFRAAECRSLKPGSFLLDGDNPAVALQAAKSKRRREDTQPIRPDLADLLAGWVDGRDSGTPVFAAMPEKTALMIRADLRRAKARWVRSIQDRKARRERLDSEFLAEADAAGRVVDFHSLRATFITLLIKSGASVKAVQDLARHSDPKLTMNMYAKLGAHDFAAALNGLPELSTPEKPQRLRATGTDTARPIDASDPRLYPHQLGRESVRSGATGRDESSEPQRHSTNRKRRKSPSQCDAARIDATGCENAPDRIRTYDLRFRKPLLYPAELRAHRSALIRTTLRIDAMLPARARCRFRSPRRRQIGSRSRHAEPHDATPDSDNDNAKTVARPLRRVALWTGSAGSRRRAIKLSRQRRVAVRLHSGPPSSHELRRRSAGANQDRSKSGT
jgi:integrase/recombinase XerC